MIVGKAIYVIDSHTAGMPTRIITGGVPHLDGNTIAEKAEYFTNNFDSIRTAIFQEPRGLLRGVGALITSPVNDKSQIGVFFMDSKHQLISMCGHGSMGVVTAAIEFGIVDVVEPVTEVTLDTPAGIVTAYAQVKDGSVKSVSIRNVPSFLYKSTKLNVPNLGSIPVNIAYGGSFFAIVKSGDIGIEVDKKNISRLSELAMDIKDSANAQISVKHPETMASSIEAVRIYNEPTNNETRAKNVVVFEKGDKGIDRSPCGTGTSAHLAVLYSKKRIKLNQEYVHESIIGTTFGSKVISSTKVGNFEAVIPEITGSAYTMGMNTIIISPEDPLEKGFLIE